MTGSYGRKQYPVDKSVGILEAKSKLSHSSLRTSAKHTGCYGLIRIHRAVDRDIALSISIFGYP